MIEDLVGVVFELGSLYEDPLCRVEELFYIKIAITEAFRRRDVLV